MTDSLSLSVFGVILHSHYIAFAFLPLRTLTHPFRTFWFIFFLPSSVFFIFLILYISLCGFSTYKLGQKLAASWMLVELRGVGPVVWGDSLGTAPSPGLTSSSSTSLPSIPRLPGISPCASHHQDNTSPQEGKKPEKSAWSSLWTFLNFNQFIAFTNSALGLGHFVGWLKNKNDKQEQMFLSGE